MNSWIAAKKDLKTEDASVCEGREKTDEWNSSCFTNVFI